MVAARSNNRAIALGRQLRAIHEVPGRDLFGNLAVKHPPAAPIRSKVKGSDGKWDSREVVAAPNWSYRRIRRRVWSVGSGAILPL